MTWRPIDTLHEHPAAMSMLVWCPENRCTFAVTHDGDGQLEWWGSDACCDESFPYVVSHWQPMPPPPDGAS